MMTVEQIRRKEQRFQLVDVRSASEFAAGHIPGTVNVPMEQVEKRLADFDLDEPVVLVCKSGTRAKIVRDLLGAKVPNVSILDGGTDAWTKDGLPLVQCQKARWSLERQVRLGAGVLILASVGLAVWVNLAWLGVTAFVGGGLTFAGATDICGMGMMLEKMPWNRS
jgi:rhodanese-related sulfurtransferase